MGTGRFLAVALAVLVLGLDGSAARQEGSLLGKVECLALAVGDVGEPEESLELTHDLLYAALKVAVTTELPRLSLDETCGNELYLAALAARNDDRPGHRDADYAVSVRLELRRQATVHDNREPGSVTVWDSGQLILGRGSEAKKGVLSTVEDLATFFVEAYRDAGNTAD